MVSMKQNSCCWLSLNQACREFPENGSVCCARTSKEERMVKISKASRSAFVCFERPYHPLPVWITLFASSSPGKCMGSCCSKEQITNVQERALFDTKQLQPLFVLSPVHTVSFPLWGNSVILERGCIQSPAFSSDSCLCNCYITLCKILSRPTTKILLACLSFLRVSVRTKQYP